MYYACVDHEMQTQVCYMCVTSSVCNSTPQTHEKIHELHMHNIIYVTRFAKRGLIHAQFQDTLFIAIC